VLRATVRIALILSITLAVAVPGCRPAGALERAGIEIAPPASWRPVKPSTWMVPGVPIAAWAGPDGSSLVLYRTPWVPGGTALMLAEALANRMENLPELRLLAKRTETTGGVPAARVEVVAPGTGAALAASGMGVPFAPPETTLVPTHQLVLGFPRPGETLYLAWHAPESSFRRLAPEIEATIKSLRFDSGAESGYRK
jgi:hypothetical protein